MKTSFTVRRISVVLAVVLFAFGCGDSFLQKKDKNSVNTDTFYDTEEQALASVNAAYALTQSHGMWGRSFFFLLDFAGQEVGPTSNTQSPPFELLDHTYSAEGNTHVNQPWTNIYDMISKTNSTIENVGEMDDSSISPNLRDRIIAEAKFLRALGYFYINAIYGGGPLRTVENQQELHLPRADPSDIWAQVESDLSDAASVLPERGGYDDADEGRATSGAAYALLGKAHLYQEEFSDAENALQRVIDQGVYELHQASDYGGDAGAALRAIHDPYTDNPPESIFEIQFIEGSQFGWSMDGVGLSESSIRPTEYGVDGFAFYNCVPAEDLIDAYDSGDPRLEAFYYGPNNTYMGEPYPFGDKGWAWRKYTRDDATEMDFASPANMVVIRYADVLLMQAEAKIRSGSGVSDGIELINDVRERSELSPRNTGAGQSQAFEWLKTERRLELAGEQTRFFDMVRWGDAADAWDSFQSGKHEVFPIPQSEINANTALSQEDQNPGY